MKNVKLILFLCALFFGFGLTQAQPILYGLTPKGGANSAGTLIKIDGSKTTGDGLTVVKHFDAGSGALTSGREAYGSMIKAGDLFYGVTSKGGAKDFGTIFSFDPSTETFIKLYDFGTSGTDGKEPFASLMLASNGKLYGTTQFGGTANKGTIFSFDLTNNTCSFIHSFVGGDNDGSNPICSLVQIPDGRIFGLTKDGGNLLDQLFGSLERCGTIFSFDPTNLNSYKLEYKFLSPYQDGDFNTFDDIAYSPLGSLVYHTDKLKLYGTTSLGNLGSGSIFSFDPATGNATPFEIVKALDQSAAMPKSTPILGSDGKLYLTTSYSINESGGVFQFDLNTNNLNLIHDFQPYNASDLGFGTNGSIFQASDGKLYGMTIERGKNTQLQGYGSVYQLPTVLNSNQVKLSNLDPLTTGNGSAGSLNEASNSFIEYINNTPPPPPPPAPTDTDADGVPDTLDIDDDNDGITDDAENGEADLLLLNPSFELTDPLITTGAGGVLNKDMVGWKTTAQDATFEVWQNGFLTVPAYEGNQFIEINGSVAATVYQDFTSTPGAIIRWTFAHRGRSGTDVVKMKVGPTGGTMVDITTASDGNTAWGVYTGVYTVPAGQTSTRIAFESVSSSNGDPTYGNFLDGIKFEVEPAFRDTDGDGIVNRLDLDSDADGCSDAKEGGATTSTTADYVFTGAVGTNGLADELETTADNGVVNYTSSYKSFAIDATKNKCDKDTDADGVPDTLDIDDDNDGITDDAENGEADLLLLNPSFELTTPLITTGAGGVLNKDMVGWKTTAQDATFEVWQDGFLTVPAYEGNQFIEINGSVAATVYQDFTSTPGAIIRWTFAHRGRSGTDVVKMKVGPTGGTMVDITTASDGNTAWGVYTGVYTVPAGQTSTRIAFESVSSSNGDPTYGNFLDGIKFEVEPAFRDTDGDGIVNRLDLDSDADGCSDAKEGGATTSTTADYVFTGAVGTNGLADELETTADNGVVNYTSSYKSFAIDATKNKCDKDTDADGVPDTLDIDDDNDGITDDAENGEADLLLLNPSFELTTPLITTGAGGVLNKDMVGWKTTAQDATFEVWQDGFLTVPAYEGNQFIEINGSVAATVYQDFTSTPGAIIRWTFAHRGRSGTDVVKMKVGPTGGTMVDITTASDGNTAWGVYTGVYTVPAGQTSTRIAFESVSSSNGDPTYGNFLDGIKFEVEPAFRDTDGDGIVNRLDLDSDADGCSDAKEGGATTSTTADYVFTGAVGTNGLADELETTADNGVVNYTSSYKSFAIDATKNACKVKPGFTIVTTACSNSVPTLPLTSDNSIPGTWSPSQVDASATNTTKYVFTPNDNSANDTASVVIHVDLSQKPQFTKIDQLFIGSVAPVLPSISNNGLSGTWSPSTINTSVPNVTKYVFTPSGTEPCLDTASLTIDVAQGFSVSPADTICLKSCATYTTQTGKSNYVWNIPGTKGIDYSLSPGSITSTTNSIQVVWLTPGQKIVSVSYGGSLFAAYDTTNVIALPATTFSGPATVSPSQTGIVESIPSAGNGATYTWTITNGTITAGKTTNSITYKAGASGKVTLCVTVKNSTGCTATATKTVTIVKITTITPTFNPIASICKGAVAPSLPSVSKNGITGTWSPAVINTATVGTKSYTFTPAAGQAAKSVSISVTIKSCKAGSGSAANATAAGIESNGLNLDAVVFPNPSNANFKLTIKSMSAERASVRVVSMMGTIMDTRLANSGETVQFGDNYNKGIYLIEIVQGNEKKLMKVMKQ